MSLAIIDKPLFIVITAVQIIQIWKWKQNVWRKTCHTLIWIFPEQKIIEQAVKSTRIRKNYRTYWLFSFYSDNRKKFAISFQKFAIFNIYHVFVPCVKLCGCRFLYLFSLCDVRNEVVFLILEHSSLMGEEGGMGGLSKKTHKKKHDILAFKPLLQEIRLKNPIIRKIFLSSNVKALK